MRARRVSQTVGGSRTDAWYDLTGLTLETGANNAIYLRAPGGRPLSDYSSGTLYDYAHDILGSVTGLIATDGTLAGSYTYDPWGNAVGTTPTAYNPFQFTGQYLDGGTGIYQMNARFYQPGSGRFTQLDPLPKNLLTGNRYAYASCNPSNRVDPTGTFSWHQVKCWAGVLALLGATAAVTAAVAASSEATLAAALLAGDQAVLAAYSTWLSIFLTLLAECNDFWRDFIGINPWSD